MALPKLVQFAVILLVIYYTLDKSGFRQPVSVFFEELNAIKSTSLHEREKRETTTNFTDYEIQVVVRLSDLGVLQMVLNNLTYPILINSTTEIFQIDTTTVCSSTISGYQCMCEEHYAWSYNNCITYQVCDVIVDHKCGCINDLPADGVFCQLNSSQTVTSTMMTSTSFHSTPYEPDNIDVVLHLHIPFLSGPPDTLDDVSTCAGLGHSMHSGNLCDGRYRNMRTYAGLGHGVHSSKLCDGRYRNMRTYAGLGHGVHSGNLCDGRSRDLRIRAGSSSGASTHAGLGCGMWQRSWAFGCRPGPLCPAHWRAPHPRRLGRGVRCSSGASSGRHRRKPAGRYEAKLRGRKQAENWRRGKPLAKDERYLCPDCLCVHPLRLGLPAQPPEQLHLSKNQLPHCLVFMWSVTLNTTTPKMTTVTKATPKMTTVTKATSEMTTLTKPTAQSKPTVAKTTTKNLINGSFTLNMDFKDSYNNPTSDVYKDIYNATKTKCQQYVSKDCDVQNLILRSGSTIAKYSLSSSSDDDEKVSLAKDEMLNQLAEKYPVEFTSPTAGSSINYNYIAPAGCAPEDKTITCQVTGNAQANKKIKLRLTPDVLCTGNDVFGDAPLNFEAVASCEEGKVGNKTAVCKEDAKFGDVQDNCVLEVIQKLLDQSEVLDIATLPGFLKVLKDATINNTNTITDSAATINAMVKIFENVGKRSDLLNITIFEESTENILESAGILTTNAAKESWDELNNGTRKNTETKNASSSFLSAFETITPHVVDKPLNIGTPQIIFTKTNFTNVFSDEFNSSVEIDIPEAGGGQQSITVIIFASMDNVLPAREKDNTSSSIINGRVALIRPNSYISNISITFDVINDTLGKPKCVFWDFDLFDGFGGWSGKGCSLIRHENDTVSCNCNHTTSFSILMSPSSPSDTTLEFITYIGVGISMGSLIICLIIEGIVWRKIRRNTTSYLRHVSIVNIAVSLLIANIWFIIGTSISKTKSTPACTAATFFIHFFYLAMFFWMLASALLLLYRTVSVFEGGLSKISMLIIGFSLGYGAPLIIATITIAATAPSNQYIRENDVCWLNWAGSKALLAFVIPALMIVAINFVILIVVLYKILRRRVGGNAAQAGEKHVLVVIARSLAVLTPFFGLTWGLGVGIMVKPGNKGIHIAFAFFNSLQGFFILVFGTLLDKTVLSEIKLQGSTSQSRTRSTSEGTLSSGVANFFKRLRKRKRSSGGYHVPSNGSMDSSNT
ncbi:adhesion G-protein coupled receptor F1-like [Fundulus heteroclitus]|uniref:adhesion G-protein coupled receptor F1-like n=1 Tax=Fundulus heteroclitus TaxID=8078 RepID=UPI00165B21ED|nr:adhesion G-protein coupled receptor F1-like [Fundulus heteroclitus]